MNKVGLHDSRVIISGECQEHEKQEPCVINREFCIAEGLSENYISYTEYRHP